ncbi:MAG TPA: tetratricopeptide repeat protein, partial [Rhodothermales bacterium]|nr:tetratricopeptide repeat protein [Rhodothermales bacterium]
YCVDCHMPSKTYMVVDPRRDHSLRVPRPDLTQKIGTPNACSDCHADKPVEWAVEKVIEWYGPETSSKGHFGETIHAGRTGREGAADQLIALAGDPSQPGIVRATAVSMLIGETSEAAGAVLRKAVKDVDPLVRMAAATASESLPPEMRLPLIEPLLPDSVRSVRIEAGRVLAPVPTNLLSGDEADMLNFAITEYEQAQWVNADRPESHVNRALIYTAQRRFQDAETAYRNALCLEPRFAEASVNLADLLRMMNRENDSAGILESALAKDPKHPALNHAYGLLLVRRKQLDKALPYLAKAAEDPALTRFNYVYAVALSEVGRKDEAIRVAQRALEERPGDSGLINLLESLR